MQGITMELISNIGVIGVLGLFLGLGLVRWYSQNTRDNARNEAEESLYKNLSAENTRMAEMLATMTVKLNMLLNDNTALMHRVAALEGSINELSVWEAKGIKLQAEVVARDSVISGLNLRLAQHELTIEKLMNRGPQ
jgi:predicted RNase H-like nuclease (RuvC/YqgF family)